MEGELFAFYGSLRRGMENYNVYKDDLLYLYSTRLQGYRLFSRGQYPFAVKTGGKEAIVVEVFQMKNSRTAESIHRLEMEEGYYRAEEMINGKKTTIYLFGDGKNYPEVPGGDWVTFFRQRASWA
jgi:gamma-glutamylcyclotransferase (GGCT)/AIG2-like uncharacterized protein YtfP